LVAAVAAKFKVKESQLAAHATLEDVDLTLKTISLQLIELLHDIL
jgi:hypothetical protein